MSKLYKFVFGGAAVLAFVIVIVYNLHGCREGKQNRQILEHQQNQERKEKQMLNRIKTYETQIDSLRYKRDSTITELFFLSDQGIQFRLDSLFNSGHLLP